MRISWIIAGAATIAALLVWMLNDAAESETPREADPRRSQLGRYWESGSIVATTGFEGRFTLTSNRARLLMAKYGEQLSLPQRVAAGATNVAFHLFSPAWVRTSITGAEFVQFEDRDKTFEFPLANADFEQPIPAGLVKFRARCLQLHQLMYGYVEASLKEHSHEEVTIALSPVKGLEVRAWDVVRDRPAGSLNVSAGQPQLLDAGQPVSRAIANNGGTAFLTPDVLTSYDPWMRIEAVGTLSGSISARLGDRPVQLLAFPRNGSAARRAAYLAEYGVPDAGF